MNTMLVAIILALLGSVAISLVALWLLIAVHTAIRNHYRNKP